MVVFAQVVVHNLTPFFFGYSGTWYSGTDLSVILTILSMKRALIYRRLVIARRRSGETAIFVITLVPSSDARGNIGKSLETFRYLGSGD